ncbi:MAG: TetR/AcrR family transcriptional regulator, partial [Myxococcota bacterium]
MGAPRARKTQEERTRATREAVLDATIRCLVRRGYAGTSTTAIQQEAGVSRGALTHHFATKQELMAAAVRHLTHTRMREFRERAVQRPADADPIEWGIHLIWREAIEGELFQAVIEIWNVARTDEALHTALRVAERELADAVRDQVSQAFGDEVASRPGFDRALRAVIVYARGAAVTNIMQRDRRRLIPFERESVHIFRCLLAAPPDPTGVGG